MGFDLLENAVQGHQVSGAIERRIEHCAICPPDLQDRVHAQHIVPAMQPAFFWEFGDGYIQNYGRARADTTFPVRSLIAAGVPAGSSDAPVTHYAPLFDIEQAMTRKTMAGEVCGPEECVDLTTALRMHTIHGAYASFEEGFKGSLEVGKAADLVVLILAIWDFTKSDVWYRSLATLAVIAIGTAIFAVVNEKFGD